MTQLVPWSAAVAYLVCWAFTTRWLARRWAATPNSIWDVDDPEDRVLLVTVSALVALLWPLVAPLLGFTRWVLRPPDRERAAAARRRAELTAWVDRAADPRAPEDERRLAREVVRALRAGREEADRAG